MALDSEGKTASPQLEIVVVGIGQLLQLRPERRHRWDRLGRSRPSLRRAWLRKPGDTGRGLALAYQLASGIRTQPLAGALRAPDQPASSRPASWSAGRSPSRGRIARRSVMTGIEISRPMREMPSRSLSRVR